MTAKAISTWTGVLDLCSFVIVDFVSEACRSDIYHELCFMICILWYFTECVCWLIY